MRSRTPPPLIEIFTAAIEQICACRYRALQVEPDQQTVAHETAQLARITHQKNPQDSAASISTSSAISTATSAVNVIAVAYSGGLDSSVLLHLAHAYAAQREIKLIALHVHHGLHAEADDWLSHCRQQAAQLGIQFDFQKIQIDNDQQRGIEHAARIGRYAALAALCRQHRATILLTAHHLDDQAETVLLQLLRGAGNAGLSAMDTANFAPALLGDHSVMLGRPCLNMTRNALEKFAQQQSIIYVNDPSNSDPRYARNALRGQVMPMLATLFPGFQQRFARTAQHAQSSQRLLIDIAHEDFLRCAVAVDNTDAQQKTALDVQQLKNLSVDRINNLMRYWFAEYGFDMPSTAWLDEMRDQLFEAKADAQLCVSHPEFQIRRYRNQVRITPRRDANQDEIPAVDFCWNGEACIAFPAFGGALYFDNAALGLDSDWLRQQNLSLRLREGGERLRLAPNRPSKPLKQHYQQHGVATWQRLQLPLVSVDGQLLFAAGIGMDCQHLQTSACGGVIFRWRSDS